MNNGSFIALLHILFGISVYFVFVIFFSMLQYKALAVPYPKDKNNVKGQVDAQEKQAVSIYGSHGSIVSLYENGHFYFIYFLFLTKTIFHLYLWNICFISVFVDFWCFTTKGYYFNAVSNICYILQLVKID